jgi:hypothetical protein
MDADLKKKVEQQIQKKFPEVAGVKPTVSSRPDNQYLFVFNAKAKMADGKTFTHTIRVVVNDQGKILKTTTSRG